MRLTAPEGNFAPKPLIVTRIFVGRLGSRLMTMVSLPAVPSAASVPLADSVADSSFRGSSGSNGARAASDFLLNDIQPMESISAGDGCFRQWSATQSFLIKVFHRILLKLLATGFATEVIGLAVVDGAGRGIGDRYVHARQVCV